jgi:protein phosphatase
MGGHAAGDVASAMTIKAIADAMNAVGPIAANGTDAGHLLMGAFANAQEWVSDRSRSDDECRGMGSTAIAGFLHGEVLHLCHVGDARGYHFSGGQLRRLTNDHSLVWDLVMSGLLTPEQARCHPHRGRIKQAIGMVSGVQPEVTSLMLRPADRVLLCSDGLWEALTEEEIRRVVGADGSMMELASILVEKADMASGQDNITAVLYEHASYTAS